MMPQTQIEISAQAWECTACGGRDAKSCSCNSTAIMVALRNAADKHADRNERERQRLREKRAAVGNAPVDNVKEFSLEDKAGDLAAEVAAPEEIKSNLFDTIERQKAVARAYRKVFAVSRLDETSRHEASAAILALINTWQSALKALNVAGLEKNIEDVAPKVAARLAVEEYRALSGTAPIAPDRPKIMGIAERRRLNALSPPPKG
jgi:hypothetical protein